MRTSPYCHLHLHSSYSLLDSTCDLNGIVVSARCLGQKYVAITDKLIDGNVPHGILHGAVKFDSMLRGNHLHPVFGCEVTVPDITGLSRLVLLAKNKTGFFNLMRIATLLYEDGGRPLERHELQKHSSGLIGLSGGPEGGVSKLCAKGRLSEAVSLAHGFAGLFGVNRFYLELQDHGVPIQKTINRNLREVSLQTGLPLVVTNHVHYLYESDHDPLCLLNHLQPQSAFARAAENRHEQMYLKSGEEMQAIFPDVPEALVNTVKIARQCKVKLEGLLSDCSPVFPIPEDGFVSNLEYLLYLGKSGLNNRCKQAGWPASRLKEARRCLTHEALMAQSTGTIDRFLIIQDIVNWAKDNGIPTGPGRGEEVGSMLAYALGITDIDPLRFGLRYERFRTCIAERPEFELEFCNERRSEVLEYIRSKYGSDCAGRVMTFKRLTSRNLVKQIGVGLGASETVVRTLQRLIPSSACNLDEAYCTSAEFRAACDASLVAKDIFRHARRLAGLPSATDVHSCAWVLSGKPLKNRVPVVARGEKESPVVQFDKTDLEYLGLMTLDVLSNPYLTRLQNVLEKIEQEGLKKPDLLNLPERDKKTFTLLGGGDLSGIYQLSSNVKMQQLIRKHRPCSLKRLIRILDTNPQQDRASLVAVIYQIYQSAFLKAHYPIQWAKVVGP